MTPLSIFSGPWGFLIKWGIIALLCAGLYGKGYINGLDHQQNADAVEHAKQQIDAQADALRIAGKQRAIANKLLGDLNDLKSHKPRITAVAGVVCNNSGPSDQTGVPGVRTDTAAGNAPSTAALVCPAVSHDADLYGECVARLHALVEAVKAAGGDKP